MILTLSEIFLRKTIISLSTSVSSVRMTKRIWIRACSGLPLSHVRLSGMVTVMPIGILELTLEFMTLPPDNSVSIYWMLYLQIKFRKKQWICILLGAKPSMTAI